MRVANSSEQDARTIRQSPFEHFYQINKDNANFLSSCLNESPKALQILLFIFSHMDQYNALICSYKVIQEALGLSQSTVSRAIKYLRDHGFIYIYKSGTNNVYVANKDLVWNSWGNNKQYCKFPANVLLSASEQEKQQTLKKERTPKLSLQ